MRVTVFGLGEAGSLIAADLALAGAAVHGYDPADVATPAGVKRHARPGLSVEGSQLVMSATSAVDATEALTQAADRIEQGAVYADLSTAAPDLKTGLATIAATHGLDFVDVALMATVPGNGLATPSLASGPGSERYAESVNRLGARVDVVSNRPGDAAARKLLRSIVVKGLTAVLMESLEAGERLGTVDWLWSHLVDLITEADEQLLKRLLDGTPRHIERRIVEMEAARNLLESLDLSPTMTSATVESLRSIEDRAG